MGVIRKRDIVELIRT